MNQPWTIHQLKDQMLKDLDACQTNHERIMVKTIAGKEIIEKAHEWSKKRKLTPGEVAIVQEFAFTFNPL